MTRQQYAYWIRELKGKSQKGKLKDAMIDYVLSRASKWRYVAIKQEPYISSMEFY